MRIRLAGSLTLLIFLFAQAAGAEQARRTLTLARSDNLLVVRGPHLPGGEIRTNYLEACCRANSANTDWGFHTVIDFATRLVSLSADGKVMKLKSVLEDGVTIDHTITAKDDEVDFRLVAHNPGSKRSEAQWAQACVRVGDFTGFGQKGDPNDYLPKCFIFLDGKLRRLPTPQWATQGRYVPGQVWCPRHVPRSDVNPRPLSPLVPSNGLIGCFSGDEKLIWATAWEPYQELFQGVVHCLHADIHLGGLLPGETRQIRGKMYIVPADVPALLRRYEADFPEHVRPMALRQPSPGCSDFDVVLAGQDRPAFRLLLPEHITAMGSKKIEECLIHTVVGRWQPAEGGLHGVFRAGKSFEIAVDLRPRETAVDIELAVRNLTGESLRQVRMNVCASVNHLPGSPDWSNRRFIAAEVPEDRAAQGRWWYQQGTPSRLRALRPGGWVVMHPSPDRPDADRVPLYSFVPSATADTIACAVQSLDGKWLFYQAWDHPSQHATPCPGNACMHLLPLLAERLEAGATARIRGRVGMFSGEWDALRRAIETTLSAPGALPGAAEPSAGKGS